MKNYIAAFLLLMPFSAFAQDKIAYKWVYTVDEQTRKYVPTTLKLFDHAYEMNMKYIFSCISRLTEQKLGIIAATLHCKKDVSNERGQMILKSASFTNDFKDSEEGKVLNISIANRDVGFNKMIGCLAGRTKYKFPHYDEETIASCLDEIVTGQSEVDLFRMKFVPTKTALSSPYKVTISSEKISAELAVYDKCLKRHGRKNSNSFPDDNELFKYCFMILENYIAAKDKTNAFVPTEVEFHKSNYSLRVLYALQQIPLQQYRHSPLHLAVKMQYDSEVALKLYEKQLHDQEAIDNQTPYPLQFLKHQGLFR